MLAIAALAKLSLRISLQLECLISILFSTKGTVNSPIASTMPPRATAIPLAFSSLRITTSPLTTRITASLPSCIQSFTTTPAFEAEKQRQQNHNPYAAEIARKRRLANINLQEELAAARVRDAADPVWGHTTSFLESIDKAPDALPSVDMAKNRGIDIGDTRLNYFLSQKEVEASLEISRTLLSPINGVKDPSKPKFQEDLKKAEEFEIEHKRTMEAIRRIISLGNGSAADIARSNTQLCIETFGRHVSDSQLPLDPNVPPAVNKTPRAGPDTGSSEVQAAILTVRIRKLARVLEKEGKKDHHNKRNLRLLVHKRQKILKYLMRREKGGIRYRNIMGALGLDDNAIEQEIFM
ncbi:hypothetical protein RUND412_005409 [Rhizina undulata]